jgi:hypothetical protein
VRPRPIHHPSATLAGAAPTLDGRWLSVWTTADGAVCVTLGAVPGDACTSRRGTRHGDEAAARVAARERLDAQWGAYSADRAAPARRRTSRSASLPASRWIRNAVRACARGPWPPPAHT